jgi:hypothetical protein
LSRFNYINPIVSSTNNILCDDRIILDLRLGM